MVAVFESASPAASGAVVEPLDAVTRTVATAAAPAARGPKIPVVSVPEPAPAAVVTAVDDVELAVAFAATVTVQSAKIERLTVVASWKQRITYVPALSGVNVSAV